MTFNNSVFALSLSLQAALSQVWMVMLAEHLPDPQHPVVQFRDEVLRDSSSTFLLLLLSGKSNLIKICNRGVSWREEEEEEWRQNRGGGSQSEERGDVIDLLEKVEDFRDAA